ncbi:MAG: pyridoxamine 5'-phosphate oxidase family protein [Candidatus Bathyarchaeia archaeon]|jgi:nitroimidazol reductase NimA-like FMN-containing flavoprotein (pyridoxamine 5'-phosphate oxidase superfamily)
MNSELWEQRIPKSMPKSDLEKQIIQFFKEQNMCVVATCSKNVPRATPIEYHSKGIIMYFIGEPGIKLKNIIENPKVSVGIFLQYTNWDSVKGAQVTGKAKIISKKTAEFEEGLLAYEWEKTATELGVTTFPETVELLKVEPEKIEFIDMSLKKRGYNPRQILTLV